MPTAFVYTLIAASACANRPSPARTEGSSAGDGEAIDPEGRSVGAGLEFEIVGGDKTGEDEIGRAHV